MGIVKSIKETIKEIIVSEEDYNPCNHKYIKEYEFLDTLKSNLFIVYVCSKCANHKTININVEGKPLTEKE